MGCQYDGAAVPVKGDDLAEHLQNTGIIKRYKAGILEKTERLSKMSKKGYEMGVLNYLEILEAQRTFKEVKTGYLTALVEYARARAKLEWAINYPLGGITSEGAK